MKKTYKIEVDCANCANKMEDAARRTAGVADVTAGASILAMADMGLFALDLSEQPIRLVRSDRAKAAPEDSAVWRTLQRWREGKF